MQVLRITTAAVVSAAGPFAVRGVRLRHTAAATATIEDGNGREVISLAIVADPLHDTIMFPAPLWLTGLEVATLSAGVLFVYLD
jgi:hypothetical protein